MFTRDGVTKMIEKGLMFVVALLIMDMHSDFNKLLTDVQYLKTKVEVHDYILKLKEEKNDKTPAKEYSEINAILPSNNFKVEKNNKQNKS